MSSEAISAESASAIRHPTILRLQTSPVPPLFFVQKVAHGKPLLIAHLDVRGPDSSSAVAWAGVPAFEDKGVKSRVADPRAPPLLARSAPRARPRAASAHNVRPIRASATGLYASLLLAAFRLPLCIQTRLGACFLVSRCRHALPWAMSTHGRPPAPIHLCPSLPEDC